MVTAVEATGSSSRLDAGLQIRLAPGWHAYWRTPGEAGLPPSIDWTGSHNVAGTAISWPAPRRFSLDGLETQGYENGVVLPIAVTLAHPGEAVLLHAEVNYAACKDICVPYQASLALTLPPGLAVPGPEAMLIAAARARVPGDLASARLRLVAAVTETATDTAILSVRMASTGAPFRAPDLFVEDVPKGSPETPRDCAGRCRPPGHSARPIRGEKAAALAGTRLRLTLVDGDRSAETAVVPPLGTLPPMAEERVPVAIIGLALLGGLVLNLMPCVLPVLSLEAAGASRLRDAERRQGRLGLLATAAGVIVSFAVLAATLILLKQAGAAIGWGIQFQQPWFLAGMALVTTLFAASLWGWVPIALPGGIAGAVGSVRGRGRLADAFLMGAFATLLAASCSAPFVGTAIGFALCPRAAGHRAGVRGARPRHGGAVSRGRRLAGSGELAAAPGAVDGLAPARCWDWRCLAPPCGCCPFSPRRRDFGRRSATGTALAALLILVMARAVLRFGQHRGPGDRGRGNCAVGRRGAGAVDER